MNLNLKTAFNFSYSKAEREAYKRALIESNKFMEKFCEGRQPRLNGEYYTPGTAPSCRDERWLAATGAMDFLGLAPNVFLTIARKLERRVYHRDRSHIYYEYSVRGLEAWLGSNKKSDR